MKIKANKAQLIKYWEDRREELRKLREGYTEKQHKYHELTGRIMQLTTVIDEIDAWEIKEDVSI